MAVQAALMFDVATPTRLPGGGCANTGGRRTHAKHSRRTSRHVPTAAGPRQPWQPKVEPTKTGDVADKEEALQSHSTDVPQAAQEPQKEEALQSHSTDVPQAAQEPQKEDPAPPPIQAEASDDGVLAGLAAALQHMKLVSGGKKDESMTCFHSIRPPAIPIQDYLARIGQYFSCSTECYVICLVFIDRLIKRHPHMAFSSLSCHRMLACSMVLAAKFHDDIFYSNNHYAKVVGLRVQELNALETKMLELLGYRLLVQPEEYEVYRRILMEFAGAARTSAAA